MKAATKQKNGSGGVIGLTKFETESGNIRQLGHQCDLDLGWSHLINIYILTVTPVISISFMHIHHHAGQKVLSTALKNNQSVNVCMCI